MTLIHLVRHAEVQNPGQTWYGRLPGFVLSEHGVRQSDALGQHFRDHNLVAVYSSPLDRALQTAEAIARKHELEVQIEPDIIESETLLEGKPGDLRLFRNPLNLRFFLNPFRPSWGESFRHTRERMLRAIDRMLDRHPDGEVVAVSHMTPIQVARLKLERDPRPPWRARPPCRRASITTLEFDGGRFISAHYTDLGAHIR